MNIGNPGSNRRVAINDHVYDRDFYCSGKIVALHGRWAWIELDENPPGTTPVTSQIVSLDLIVEEQNQAA